MAAMALATKAELHEFLVWCYATVFPHKELGEEGWFYCPMCRAPYQCVARHILACRAQSFDAWYAALTEREADALNVTMLLNYSDEWAEHQRALRASMGVAVLAEYAGVHRLRQPFFYTHMPAAAATEEVNRERVCVYEGELLSSPSWS